MFRLPYSRLLVPGPRLHSIFTTAHSHPRYLHYNFARSAMKCNPSYPNPHRNDVNACKRTQSSLFIREMSSSTEEPKEDVVHNNDNILSEFADWTPLFRFTYQPHFQLVSRFKVAQTSFLVVGSPIAVGLFSTGIVSGEVALGVISLATFALAVLVGVSQISRRIAGVISLHRDEEIIRIGHLTFWGRRQDTIWPVSEVIPPSDLGESSRTEILLRIGRNSSSREYFLLPARWGEIVDQKKFFDIFGPIH